MIVSRAIRVAGAFAVIACLVPRESHAQSIAQRVASVRDGQVRMTYASRHDICGWDNGITAGAQRDNTSNRSVGRSESEDVEYDTECSRGPVRLVLTLRGGSVDRIRAYVGGRWRSRSNVTDLGTVSSRAAVDYLLALANAGSRDAIFPTTLADSVNVTQPLYEIARSESKDKDVRDQALFWLSQQPDDAAVGLLENILRTGRSEDIRDKAIFGLSQHHSGKGFPILRQYAEDARAPRDLRGKAIFWLGQRKGAERFDYLRGLYSRLDDEDLRDKVIFAMSQQKDDAAMKWLVDLASNSREPMEMRKKALFWAGQTGNSVESLTSMYDRMREEEMKEQMIFVLSQRHERAAVDKLMSIARTDADRDLRQKAMFWLGQSKDPRVAAFLSDIITR